MSVDLASYTSPQMKIIQEMYRGVLEKDLNCFVNSLHKDFRHVFHPQSFGKAPVNRDEWIATVLKLVVSAPTQFDFTWNSIVDAPGKVVIHASVKAKGLSAQDETDESIWILEFASGEDGSLKVKGLEQFTSEHYIELFHART